MKRLYKTSYNKMIAGVCSGLAEYLNVDVSIVRIVWGVLGLCFGTGILLYLVAAFVLPYKEDVEDCN